MGGGGGRVGSDVSLYIYFFFLSAEVIVTRLVAPQTAAVSAHVRCTPYNIQSHICRVHVYGEAGTCHPHLSQKDRDLYVLLRGWKRHRNKSQHRKLSPEKQILPLLLRGLKPATFWSRVRRSNHWAIPWVVLQAHVSANFDATWAVIKETADIIWVVSRFGLAVRR